MALELIKVPLSAGAGDALKKHLRTNIESINKGLKPYFESKFVKMRQVYEATPAQKIRSFPFKNASNLVVPVAAIHCDTLHAAVMSATFKTRPLFVARLLGQYTDDMDHFRKAWEDFLQEQGDESEELDLYRVEEAWFAEIIRYGTSVIKSPYITQFIDTMVPAGDGSGKGEVVTDVHYRGPRPEKLPYEDFGVDPSTRKLSQANFKFHRCRLRKWELLERRYKQFYDPSKVDDILKSPDRTSPGIIQQQREEDSEAKSGDEFEEWDVYECWLSYRAPNQAKAPKIICWYHLKTNTLLRAVYDTYPIEPFIAGRLLYRDDSWFGYGLCEVLAPIQEEISMMHNQRRDNQTVATTKMFRADPDSKIHEGYDMYPSAVIPARKDEFEAIAMGEVSGVTIEEERLSLELAEKRSGVSPPMQGYGAGTNTKRGVYSSMGTLSLLQEGNRRTDLNIADLRAAHTQLGRVISKEYAHFGIDESSLLRFGVAGDIIKQAAELIRVNKLGLPIYAATASINKEVEKQSDMMLHQLMTRHYGMVAQMLQQISVVTTPDDVKKYLMDAAKSANKLVESILRSFDRDDPSQLVPKIVIKQQAPNKSGPTVLQPQQSTGGPGMPGGQASFGVPTGVAKG